MLIWSTRVSANKCDWNDCRALRCSLWEEHTQPVAQLSVFNNQLRNDSLTRLCCYMHIAAADTCVWLWLSIVWKCSTADFSHLFLSVQYWSVLLVQAWIGSLFVEGQQVREAPWAFQRNGSSSPKAIKTILQKYSSVLHSLDLNPISFRHELECKLPAKPCLPTYLSNPYVNKGVQPPGSWLLTLLRKSSQE